MKARSIKIPQACFEHEGLCEFDSALRTACMGETLRQILVPIDLPYMCFEETEHGFHSISLESIILVFDARMAALNFGSIFVIENAHIQDYPELEVHEYDSLKRGLYCSAEQFHCFDCCGKRIVDCGCTRKAATMYIDSQDAEIFGVGMFFDLEDGSRLIIRSAETAANIEWYPQEEVYNAENECF